MECECCSKKIRDVRDYFEYHILNVIIITCESCYETLQEGPQETSDKEFTVYELIDALPS